MQFSPGELKTAVAPISNPTARGFNYTAELYLGLPKAVSSGVVSFYLAAGETKNVRFPVTMPQAGTYPVYIDVFVAGQLIGAYQASEDVTIGVPGVPIDAAWQCAYNTHRGYYGQLVKAKITIDSPEAFTGELKVSLPGEIAGTGLVNYDQMLKRAPTTIAQVDPEGEFYIGSSYSTALKALVYGHYSKLMEARDSVSHTVAFPADTSTFDIAFFLRPDYFRYSYSSGDLEWVDAPYYLPTVHSPTVELYDEDGSLLQSKVYTNAIEVKPVDEYPVSIDIPATIASGGEAWAGFTMFLPYKNNCDYEISLYVKEPTSWNLAFGEVVDINWYNKKDNWYLGGAEPISADGQFTFSGLLEWQDGKYGRVPAKAIYKPSRFLPLTPVPPGIYKVYMSCNLKFISYATDTATKYSGGGLKWRDVEVGEIEVV